MGSRRKTTAETQDTLSNEASASISTFEGTLTLGDFAYTAETPPRRSPRRPATTITTTTTITSPVRSAATPRQRSATSSPSPSKVTKTKKRSRPPSGYAPPSTYAHLPLLPDAIAPNLLILFIGLNPGIQTARSGHAYAHPSNLFWKLLFSSGITTRLCRPDEDRLMPELFATGHTNIVARPSRNGSELSKQEMDDGVEALHEKARRWRPETLCVVGKSIWESIWRVRHGRPVGKDFKYGWQDETENMGVIEGEWPGSKVFVASSTSGLAATLSPQEKQRIWAELGDWTKARRAEKELEANVEGS